MELTHPAQLITFTVMLGGMKQFLLTVICVTSLDFELDSKIMQNTPLKISILQH